MSKFLFVALFMFVTVSVQAQEFVFDYNEMEMEETESNLASSQHPFGTEFTEMMQLLREFYTSEERNTISQTTTPIVEKPSIYYSVKKTNKHLVKAVKKGHMDVEDAKKELGDILVKALNIRYQNTEALEEKLGKIKDTEMLLAFYGKDIKLDM
ncbi:MAG: hypothetical protein ABJF04_13690 [Reichenbachiella sp.]|uniref:hypothetical protein n=1 Tax=Reichenbachiella sp. TaxID=2184521 RepID=UPI003267D155